MASAQSSPGAAVQHNRCPCSQMGNHPILGLVPCAPCTMGHSGCRDQAGSPSQCAVGVTYLEATDMTPLPSDAPRHKAYLFSGFSTLAYSWYSVSAGWCELKGAESFWGASCVPPRGEGECGASPSGFTCTPRGPCLAPDRTQGSQDDTRLCLHVRKGPCPGWSPRSEWDSDAAGRGSPSACQSSTEAAGTLETPEGLPGVALPPFPTRPGVPPVVLPP